MKKFTDRRTDAEKQASAEAIQAVIDYAQSLKGMKAEDMRAELTGAPVLRFDGHELSPRNQMIARFQNPKCLQLAGFKQWQSVGRQVLKGAKSIIICAATTSIEDNSNLEILKFSTARVFDISQTLPFAEAEALRQGQKQLAEI